MEASSHSHTCAGLVPSGKPLSQRVARHALAILHLLTTEDDTGASGDIGSFLSVDLVIPGKKRILQRIQKLVLGIIHLLTEGTPQFDDVAVGMSDEDWINVEREQRELYRDLMTENELTLHSIASNNVKTETASRMDRAEPRMERSEPRVESQQSAVERDRPPGGVLGTFSTPLPCTSGVGPLGTGDTTCFEDYEASFIDATKNDHPDTYKNNSKQLPLSTHHETTYRPTPSDSCVESYHKGFPESLLSTYPSTLPDTCQNALLSNISDTYQNTLPDKLPVIQIKQEGSQMELNSWHWTVEAGSKTRSLPAERPMEILAKKQSTSPKISSHCRNSTLVKDNSRKLSGLVVAAAVSESRETEPKSKKQNEQLKRHAGKSEIRPPSRKPQWKKPFECLRCEKSFNCRSHLVMHQRVHTRERPYVCSDCGKSFTQSSNLFRHQRGHRGERPHVCTYCGKTFTHSSYLLIHQRTHTGEKPYSCSDCGKCFRVNSTLVRHQRVHMVGNIAPAPKPNHFT